MTPLILHQTWKTKDISNFKNYHKTFYDIKWLTKKIYDDNDIDEYVKNNFSSFYDFFKNMNKMIERVDFFRYCVMYRDGGLYCDIDVICNNSNILYNMLKTNKIILGVEKSLNRYLIGQAILISPPNNKFWVFLMTYIKYNYSPLKYPPHNTGPDAVSAFYKIYKKKIKDVIISNSIYNNVFSHVGTGVWRADVIDMRKLCNICKQRPDYCMCYRSIKWVL